MNSNYLAVGCIASSTGKPYKAFDGSLAPARAFPSSSISAAMTSTALSWSGEGRQDACHGILVDFARRSANPMRHPLEDNLVRDRVNSQCEHKHKVHRQGLLVHSVEIVNHVKIAIF